MKRKDGARKTAKPRERDGKAMGKRWEGDRERQSEGGNSKTKVNEGKAGDGDGR